MHKSDVRDLIVDLHIHSHYSRATSKHMNISALYRWGKIKGIHIIGTGDFTHPAWFAELQEKLEPAEPGLYKLKEKFAQEENKHIPESCKKNLIRFVLTVEISNIYSKGGKVRKLHNIVIVPNFKTASKMNSQLDRIGNIQADGRPILGMDSKDLLKMTIETNPNSLFIPAHIWTPWFAMFGSKSGFDSIEEAFEDYAKYIYAVETGLSSDPFMNWRVGALDNVTLISNSDAHSPQKLAREANMIKSSIDYFDIMDAIKTNDDRFIGTIEFFPEEGKYHYDGHRKCNVSFMPSKTKEHEGICPKCHQPLVVGVQYRVDELSTRPESFRPKTHKKIEYIIPLVEVIAESKGVKGTNTKTVMSYYDKIIAELGNEFDLLRNVSIEDIKNAGFADVAHALAKVRKGDVVIDPGYDGVFGTIKIFEDGEIPGEGNEQLSLGI